MLYWKVGWWLFNFLPSWLFPYLRPGIFKYCNRTNYAIRFYIDLEYSEEAKIVDLNIVRTSVKKVVNLAINIAHPLNCIKSVNISDISNVTFKLSPLERLEESHDVLKLRSWQ